ncbi:MAG: GntR family transcriptional regulator [Alphaproteobacteria bacterium]|nr:GntR family transcriptional regulator [Alphaproteobacteria bacterium]
MHTDLQKVLDRLILEANGVPIYVQLRDQFLSAIGEGRLKPGEQMPTMRQVAVALKVDLNTVRHAYSDLERHGAIVILRAKGTYVADVPPKTDPHDRDHQIEERALRAIADARTHGVDPGDVARRILKMTKKGG